MLRRCSSQPMCSTMIARLNVALVAVGTVVGLVVVSDGAQNPPIQYHDCAMICCRRSIGSLVTMATSSTTDTISWSDVFGRHPGKISLDEGSLAANDRSAHHQPGQCGMRLHIRFSGGDEPQTQKVICHPLPKYLVRGGGSLKQLLKVWIREQLSRRYRVQIAVVDAIDFRHGVHPQLRYGIQQTGHR
jgi:hypothetical protein